MRPGWESGSPTGADSLLDYAGRVPRLVTLWLDPQHGLLRWAPFFALAFFAIWLLRRSRREHLARALPSVVEAEVAAGLLLAVCAGALLVATFAAPRHRGPVVPRPPPRPGAPLPGRARRLGAAPRAARGRRARGRDARHQSPCWWPGSTAAIAVWAAP